MNGVSCCFWIFLLGLRLGSFVAPARFGWLIGQLADELPRHDHCGGPQQHGLVMLGEPRVIADQTPVPVQPTETTFHDPPAGKHDEPAQVVAALPDHGRLAERLAGRRSVVFLDYDGVLTPIVDRLGDGVISDSIWDTVQALAQRCTAYVVSGRNRAVVDELMGANDLVVAGSHDFDIWSPNEGEIQHDASSGFSDLVGATYRLRAEAGSIPGVVVEPKMASVAMHYRPDRLKTLPGKIVDELPPKIDRQTPTTSRSLTRGADLVLIPPTEVEQLLSTPAR